MQQQSKVSAKGVYDRYYWSKEFYAHVHIFFTAFSVHMFYIGIKQSKITKAYIK